MANKGEKKANRRGVNPKSLANLEKRKKWSAEYQPPPGHIKEINQKRRLITDILIRELENEQTVVVHGYDLITGKPTQIRVDNPTKEVIARQMLKQAANGNMYALSQLMDRVEGKVPQPIEQEMKPENYVPRFIKLPDGTLIPV